MYNSCASNKVISLGLYYLITKNEFIISNLDFKTNGFIKLYKHRFFKRRNIKITYNKLAKIY